jgi:anaerobic ribonucleoside-triphosphate reductase activating protein
MRVNGILTGSAVNGQGWRYVIFVQGCPHHCKGCHNPQTWDINGGKDIPVENIIADISNHRLIDGVTFSGGEPFQQQHEADLIRIADWCHAKHLDIWAYTGYEAEKLTQTRLIHYVDYLVDGQFKIDLKTDKCLYRGSSNQRIINVKEFLHADIK